MNKKTVTMVIVLLILVIILGWVVFVAQKTKKQEMQSSQNIQQQDQNEKQADQAEEAQEPQEPQLIEMKPIDLQTVQPQSEADANNWLTYESENKHFTIKYPPELFIKEPVIVQEDDSSVMGGDTALVISDNEDAKLQAIDPSEAVHIIISMPKKKEGKTLKEIVYGMAAGEEDLVSEIVVNGNKGFRVFTEKRTVPLLYFFERDDQVYTLFGFTYLEGTAAKDGFNRMEEIYSTFDFL